MIDPTHELPIVRQAELLDLSRSSVYYLPQATPEAELALMRRIDELHLEYPFAGARMLRDLLRREGHAIGRKRVATLMRRMDIEALYQKASTSRRHAAHPVYPYLLRGRTIDTPNQVWAMDTTYIPMRRGFIYLTAVLDWATRRVLAWRLSNSLGADVAVAAVEEAILKYGAPGIMNTDQGSPVHQRRFRRRDATPCRRHQHGRQGVLARQRLCRATLEDDQVRARLPACLRDRVRSPDEARHVSRVLQSPAAAHGA